LKNGGKAKSFAATKFGAAMMKKSADTKGRAMVKKADGGKCYAKGGKVKKMAVGGMAPTTPATNTAPPAASNTAPPAANTAARATTTSAAPPAANTAAPAPYKPVTPLQNVQNFIDRKYSSATPNLDKSAKSGSNETTRMAAGKDPASGPNTAATKSTFDRNQSLRDFNAVARTFLNQGVSNKELIQAQGQLRKLQMDNSSTPAQHQAAMQSIIARMNSLVPSKAAARPTTTSAAPPAANTAARPTTTTAPAAYTPTSKLQNAENFLNRKYSANLISGDPSAKFDRNQSTRDFNSVARTFIDQGVPQRAVIQAQGQLRKLQMNNSSTPAQHQAAIQQILAQMKSLVPSKAAGGSGLRPLGGGFAKGGSTKAATKSGRALVKKSADTEGRAMKKYAKGGLVGGHKAANGVAKKGLTKGKQVKMNKGGACYAKGGSVRGIDGIATKGKTRCKGARK
jgi:hypothetical protein